MIILKSVGEKKSLCCIIGNNSVIAQSCSPKQRQTNSWEKRSGMWLLEEGMRGLDGRLDEGNQKVL